jgi:hypothetical protein
MTNCYNFSEVKSYHKQLYKSKLRSATSKDERKKLAQERKLNILKAKTKIAQYRKSHPELPKLSEDQITELMKHESDIDIRNHLRDQRIINKHKPLKHLATSAIGTGLGMINMVATPGLIGKGLVGAGLGALQAKVHQSIDRR